MDQPKQREGAMTLHDIVVDYVINSAYAGTAAVLASAPGPARPPPSPPAERMDEDEPADVDADADDEPRRLEAAVLTSINQRRAIIDYILNGAIVRAVDALHNHFPTVLSTDARAGNGETNGVSGNGSRMSNGASVVSGASSVRSSSMAGGTPLVVSSSGTTSASHTPSLGQPNVPDHATPVFARSADPDHVRLNLQIQQFIESFRQLSPSAPSSPSSSIGSLNGSSMNGSASAQLTAALTALQGLHTEATRLRPDHRAVYLQEIKDVGALFAYTDPEKSILSGFLDQARRVALAQQVNAAILRSEGRPVQSQLEQIARRTSAIYTTLNEHGIDPQPSWTGDAKGAAHWRIAEQLKRRPFQKGGFSLHEYVWELA